MEQPACDSKDATDGDDAAAAPATVGGAAAGDVVGRASSPVALRCCLLRWLRYGSLDGDVER